MHPQTYSPGLTAATTTGRALIAAGWIYDSTTPMADDTTIRTLLHPSGREIHARTDDGDELTDLTLTGLTLEQVAGAVTGAGLAPAEPTDDEIADEIDKAFAEETSAQPEPDLRQRLAVELHRIADDIVAQQLPVGAYMTLNLGVLSSRAGLEQLAAYLGSTIQVEGSNGIPWTEAAIKLADAKYGPEMQVRAQIQPDEESELERLRARNAELEAQLAEGGADR